MAHEYHLMSPLYKHLNKPLYPIRKSNKIDMMDCQEDKDTQAPLDNLYKTSKRVKAPQRIAM